MNRKLEQTKENAERGKERKKGIAQTHDMAQYNYFFGKLLTFHSIDQILDRVDGFVTLI